jgi:threonine dehydrogenase-like Zn-dependent dehydrogenase
VFKVDDADALDAHALVSKARNTGREGREGFRFHKAGGVWEELAYLPASPLQVQTAVKAAKSDRSRTEPATFDSVKADLNAVARGSADASRRLMIRRALTGAGPLGLSSHDLARVVGCGKGMALHASLQELERSGDVEKHREQRWRLIPRGE